MFCTIMSTSMFAAALVVSLVTGFHMFTHDLSPLLLAMLLVAGENGIGKRTPFDDYRRQLRGGKGIITMKTGEKTGNVVGALTVTENDELMLITTKGQMVRTRVKEIRAVGRNTMGVKLIDLREGETLQDIAPVVSQEEGDVEQNMET